MLVPFTGNQPAVEVSASVTPPPTLTTSGNPSTPQALRKPALRGLYTANKLDELASIELGCHLKTKDEDLDGEDLQLAFRTQNVKPPTTITLETIATLQRTPLSWALRHLCDIRKDIIEQLPGGLFAPKDGDLLVDWIADGRRYAGGERLPAKNFEKHPSNNRPWLTDEAMHYVRHIVHCFRIPVERFSALWNCFAVLFLRRAFEDEDFRSPATILYRCHRLQLIDEFRFKESFKVFIVEHDVYGFTRYFYMVSDDSKFFKRDERHVLIITTGKWPSIENGGTKDRPDPGFHFLTARRSVKKGSEENAAVNKDAFDQALPEEAKPHFGGGVSKIVLCLFVFSYFCVLLTLYLL